MTDMLTDKVPRKLYMLHTQNGNEFYLDRIDAIDVKDGLDEALKAQGLSRRTPMFEIGLQYEVDKYDKDDWV